MASEPTVAVVGLRDFRGDLKHLRPDIQKELQGELKTIAQDVAQKAAASAPRRTGTMATSYRGAASTGLRAVVRNRQFYSRFIEFGFHPRGSSTMVAGRNVIGRILERDEDRIVDEVGDALERAAEKAGWR